MSLADDLSALGCASFVAREPVASVASQENADATDNFVIKQCSSVGSVGSVIKSQVEPEPAPAVRSCCWRVTVPGGEIDILTSEPITAAQAMDGRADVLRCIPFYDGPEVAPEPLHAIGDQISCGSCRERAEAGACLACRRGEIPQRSRYYQCDPSELHRCAAYLPDAGEADQRPGWERWPHMAERWGFQRHDEEEQAA